MPDRREVEHAEGLAQQLCPDARHDDVGRGADQGDDAAEERAEGHRHEKAAKAACWCAGRSGTRRESSSRARRYSSRRRTAPSRRSPARRPGSAWCADRAPTRFRPASSIAGFRHRGADQKGARDDDDDVVAEALEGLVGRHDADEHRHQKRQRPRRDRSAAGPRRRAPSSRRRWRRRAFADGSWGTRARGTTILTRRGPVGAVDYCPRTSAQ